LSQAALLGFVASAGSVGRILGSLWAGFAAEHISIGAATGLMIPLMFVVVVATFGFFVALKAGVWGGERVPWRKAMQLALKSK
jgi:hypothetical protein